MMRRKKCRLREHTDVRIRGSSRVRCTTCGDVFPCRTACEHFDCGMVNAGEIDALTHELVRPLVRRPVVSGEQLELVIVTGGDS